MPRTITISMPVSDLNASTAFYTALGFVLDPTFSNESGAFLVWSEHIKLTIVTQEKWSTFTTRPLPPKGSAGVGLMLSCESRAEVDAMNAAAAAHGGIGDVNPIEDHPGWYGRDFTDPDGRVWGALWMDPSATPSE